MRKILTAILAVAFWLSLPSESASAQTIRQEYFGLICHSEPLARAIGEGFRQDGSLGFERRASIAIGNGCSFIGPYVLPNDQATTTVTSWVYDNRRLTLRVTRARDAQGNEVLMYGYMVSVVNET